MLMKKVFLVLLSFILFACGSKNAKVVFETEGKEYKSMDNVSFYYPKDFKIDLPDNNIGVSFDDEDEVYKYIMVLNDYDNDINDYPQLYLGQLEEDGVIQAEYSSIVLENRMQCFEYTGVYKTSGMWFKQVVYFTKDATYVYMYLASEDVYEKKISQATQYLRTLTVHNEQVS